MQLADNRKRYDCFFWHLLDLCGFCRDGRRVSGDGHGASRSRLQRARGRHGVHAGGCCLSVETAFRPYMLSLEGPSVSIVMFVAYSFLIFSIIL